MVLKETCGTAAHSGVGRRSSWWFQGRAVSEKWSDLLPSFEKSKVVRGFGEASIRNGCAVQWGAFLAFFFFKSAIN